jgi:hypothetical protein
VEGTGGSTGRRRCMGDGDAGRGHGWVSGEFGERAGGGCREVGVGRWSMSVCDGVCDVCFKMKMRRGGMG